MSGFIAVFQQDGAPVDVAWLGAATASLAFRGPDVQQIWHSGPVGLGHTLLRSTLEAENESQPLTFDGQVWLVGDVRMDGRAELLTKLRGRGRVVAEDAPDANLILHAYLAWGEACPEHLLGDFSFVVWDARVGRLFGARDHFGTTPFYYAQAGGALLVSNTLETLRLHPAVADTLDEKAISEFLLFGLQAPSDITTFAAIRRLRPAHVLTAGLEGLPQARRYWSPPEWTPLLRLRRPEEYVEQFRDLFDQAVSDRLRAHAVATHLSGGMDSGSISGTAHRLLQGAGQPFDLRGYNLSIRELIPDDEADFAQQVADKRGFPLEIIPIDDFYLHEPTASPPFIYPEPFGLPGELTQQEIAERAAGFSRVLLMGFGGDPLFNPHQRPPGELLWAGSYRAALRGLLRPLFYRVSGRGARQAAVLRSFTLPGWYDAAFAQRTGLAERFQARLQAQNGQDAQRGMATEALWESIFIYADEAYTRLPLKTRWPFFDLRLFNFMLSIPPEPWCRAKYLLRQAMRDTLPEAVRTRKKTPLRGQPEFIAWQRRGGVPWIRELAAAPELAAYVDRRKLAQQLTMLTPLSLKALMPTLALAYWLRHQPDPQISAWREGGAEIASRQIFTL